MSFNDINVKKERIINIMLHPKLWIYNAKDIHEFNIPKMPIHDKHVSSNKTLDLHLCNDAK
jgi:hypothetical protein